MIAREPLGFEVWGLCVLVAWYRARVQSPAHLASGQRARDLVHVEVPFSPRSTREETP
jgi:hypothetical protein